MKRKKYILKIKFKMYCKNQKNGCKYEEHEDREKINEHFKTCKYQSFMCPYKVKSTICKSFESIAPNFYRYEKENYYCKFEKDCLFHGTESEFLSHIDSYHDAVRSSICEWKNSIEYFVWHYITEHNEIIYPVYNFIKLDASIVIYKITDTYDPQYKLLSLYHTYFLYYFQRNIHQNSASWVIQHVAVDTPAEMYYYKLQIFSFKNQTRSITITEDCLGHNCNVFDAINSGDCATVSIHGVKSYFESDKNLQIILTVFKKANINQNDD